MVYLLYTSFFWFVSLDGLIIWILFFFFALMTHLPPQSLKVLYLREGGVVVFFPHSKNKVGHQNKYLHWQEKISYHAQCPKNNSASSILITFFYNT